MVSRQVMRRRRQFATGGAILFAFLAYLAFFSGGSGPPTPTHSSATTSTKGVADLASRSARSPLDPAWRGDRRTVTLGFGGDVHFEGPLGERLVTNPSTALGTTIPELFSGAQVSMANLETVVTDGICPEPQNKQYIFDAPASAVTALKSAQISLMTEANDHGMDCGPQGLSQNLTIASQSGYPIIGIGNTAAQAFTPYRITMNGQRIAIVTATQVLPDNLANSWTATPSQPGVASAIDPTALVREVEQLRSSADTVIVFVHWGTETQACPDPQQEPLARQLVRAGADIVVGSDAHVLLGAGYLGQAYVDYGLGNFAFYDTSGPEINSGTLIVKAEGRHVVRAVWRPATIQNGLPQPLTGTAATAAVQSWNAARDCTNLSETPTASLASEHSEKANPVAPPTTTTTSSSGATTTTGAQSRGTTTTTPQAASTSSTVPASSTTAPTDNAGTR